MIHRPNLLVVCGRNKKRSRTHDKKKKKDDDNEDECMEVDSEDEIKFDVVKDVDSHFKNMDIDKKV